MKYAFLVNPIAGTGKSAVELKTQIDKLIEREEKDIRCYQTEGVEDAEVLAESLAKEAKEKGEDIAIYACGGDGTANEVVNSILGYDNAKFGVVPIGSGNDLVRVFGELEMFLNLSRQVNATPKKIDLIKITYVENGERIERYCVNGVNIGFDGNTAILAHKLKKIPAVSGTVSYLMSVFINLLEKKGQDLIVTVDGEVIHRGPLLLCTVSNGRFCGGGIELCSRAKIDDGYEDILIVKSISRTKFVRLFGKVKKGQLFEVEGLRGVFKYKHAKRIVVKPAKPTMKYVVDGEISTSGTIELEIIPNAIEFMVP